MVTVILVLIALLVVVRLFTAGRDRSMKSRGVDLSRETWEDRLPPPPRAGVPLWSGSTWPDTNYDSDGGGTDTGGGDFGGGDSGGGGDFGSGDSGGGGDFGGGDSG